MQLGFEFRDPVEPEADEPARGGRKPRRSIDERWEDWIEGHGAKVYATFAEIATQIKATGRARFGGKAIAEIARFYRVIEGKDSENYKVNNSFVTFMCKRLVDERPEFQGWFEFRTRKGETEGGGED